MNGTSYIETGGCAAALAFLVWNEVRAKRARLWWRLAAVVMAMAALAGLVLPFLHWQKVGTIGSGREGVYLTEGYNPDSVRNFLAAHGDVAGVWEAPGGIDRAVSRLHVFGYGLTIDRWAGIGAPELVLHPVAPVEGIVWADWKRRLYIGEKLEVRGRWQPGGGVKGRGVHGGGLDSERRKAVEKVELLAFGAVLDSAGADGEFALATVPAQIGRAVYRLVVVSGKDTLEQEEIPVEVGHSEPLSVLILAAAPDFEHTFLINWLGKNGQRAAVRTAVSRDRYQASFLNMRPRPLERLTASLLEGFDVVIADESVVKSDGEGGLLRSEVEKKGLGLIVRTDSVTIRKIPGMRTILRDSLSRPLVGGQVLGLGKLFYTASNTTYMQVMGGQPAAYASYWADLLRLVARRGGQVNEWSVGGMGGTVGEEMEMSLQTNDVMPQGVVVQGGRAASVYLAEDAVLGFRWSGRYWPETAGWATVGDAGKDTSWFFVWPRGSWTALKREARLRDTREYRPEGMAVAGAGKGKEVAGEEGKGKEAAGEDGKGEGGKWVEVPKGWFYTIFLLCLIYLWVEGKVTRKIF